MTEQGRNCLASAEFIRYKISLFFYLYISIIVDIMIIIIKNVFLWLENAESSLHFLTNRNRLEVLYAILLSSLELSNMKKLVKTFFKQYIITIFHKLLKYNEVLKQKYLCFRFYKDHTYWRENKTKYLISSRKITSKADLSRNFIFEKAFLQQNSALKIIFEWRNRSEGTWWAFFQIPQQDNELLIAYLRAFPSL